jgi:hypothetical protein
MTAVGVPPRPPRPLVLPTDGRTGSVAVTAARRWGSIALELPGAGPAGVDWDAWRLLVRVRVRVWVLGFDCGGSRGSVVSRWLRPWMGLGLGCDCSSILVRAGDSWDVYDANCSTASAGMSTPYNGIGGGNGSDSPGSATELFSMALQSIQQASWCCNQAWQSFPRSILFPIFSRKHLSVTTTIPFLQRVRATFMRG